MDGKLDANSHLRELFHQMDELPLSNEAFVVEELRKEVFTSLDGVQLLAVVLELFTWQFAATSGALWETVSENEYWDEENKLLDYFERRALPQNLEEE